MSVQYRTVTDDESGEVYHFASVDGGELWLGVGRKPAAADETLIGELIDGVRNTETGGTTKPMMVAARWFGFGPDDWGTASEVETL